MAWPSGTKASTTNVDNGADLISNARADIKQNIDNVNDIIDHLNISSPNNGDLLQYSTATGKWEQVAASSVGSATDVALLTISGVGENVSANLYRRPVTESFDPNNIVTTSTYQFTLAAGNYIFEVNSTELDSEVSSNLYNETDSTQDGIIATYNEIGTTGEGIYNGLFGLTIAGTKSFSIRQESSTSTYRNSNYTLKITKI